MKTILAWVKKVHWPSLAIVIYLAVGAIALFYWILMELISIFDAMNFR